MDTSNSQVKLRNICETCNRGFDYASYLQKHQLTHTGERSFVCQICDKTFSMGSNLKIHVLIHSGER